MSTTQAGAGLTKTMAPRTKETIERYPLPEAKGDWAEFYENVAATIHGEAESLITYDEQRRLLRLIEAVFKSGGSGEVVKLAL